MPLERLSWNKFWNMMTNLVKRIGRENKIDAVVGVGRSGTIPASIIAKMLRVDEFYSVRIKLYDEGKPPKRLGSKPEVLFQNVGDLKGKRVLVVDDFLRTGSTLRSVKEVIIGKGAKDVKYAVIALRADARIVPDYYSMKFEDCVVFPWDISEK